MFPRSGLIVSHYQLFKQDFYLIKGNNGEDCRAVLETYDNKLSRRSNVLDGPSLEDANEVWSLSQNDYKHCEISDCGDPCDGCSIRFYHNSIDEDEFFEHSQVSKLRKINKVC